MSGQILNGSAYCSYTNSGRLEVVFTSNYLKGNVGHAKISFQLEAVGGSVDALGSCVLKQIHHVALKVQFLQ
jgi:hypothetical protein